jgi:hypothetical protein
MTFLDRRAAVLAFAAALAWGAAVAGTEPASPPPNSSPPEPLEVRSGEPILAFNGKNLDGFYTYLHRNHYDDPEGVFTVRDGMLVISGREFGGITTREEFSDYHLIVEWKWGSKTWPPRADKARDSGILLHCVGPDGAAGGFWMQSQECQIIEGGCGDFIMVPGLERPSLTCETRMGSDGQLYYQKGGEPRTLNSGRFNWWGRDPEWKDVIGFRGRWDVESPLGEWNRMEVVCQGDRIINAVNGVVVNVGTGSSLTRGKIMIQSEGAEIIVRKLEIRPLIQ